MPEDTCAVEVCDQPPNGARGWCRSHYARWQRWGDPEGGRPRYDGAACSIAGCEKPAKARGWCTGHYMRWTKTGAPDTPLTIRGKGT